MPLSVPVPTLAQEGATPPTFSSAKPVQIACGPVLLPDGTQLVAAEGVRAGFLLGREGPSGQTEAWDDAAKQWNAAPGVAEQPLVQAGGTWQGIVIAMGKDAAGQDKAATGPTGFPRYFVTCSFGVDIGGAPVTGSARSAAAALVPPGQTQRAGVLVDPDPDAANEMRLFLRDPALAERAFVSLRAESGGFVVELGAMGAHIVVRGDGSVAIEPGANGTVLLQGAVAVDGSLSVNGHAVTP
jgi:hypothetical protein